MSEMVAPHLEANYIRITEPAAPKVVFIARRIKVVLNQGSTIS